MNKRKLFISIIIVLLIGIVFYFYNAFNGNPISKLISKKTLETYLEETYPDNEFRLDDGFYNFKFGQYQFVVTELGTLEEGQLKEYEFNVRGFIFPQVSWDGRYYDHLDTKMMNRLSAQAKVEMTTLLHKKVDNIEHIGVDLEVLKGKFDDDVKWSKDLPLEKPIEVFVQIDSTKQTKDDFLSTVKQIVSFLDEEGYDYESVMFNGSGFDEDMDEAGYLKYSIRVDIGGIIKKSEIEEHNPGLW